MKTPWKVDSNQVTPSVVEVDVLNARGAWVCNVNDTERANHIVRCVNLHDELAAALQETAGTLEGRIEWHIAQFGDGGHRPHDLDRALERVCTVLAKLER